MKNLIEKIKGKKILVVGDLMLDIYLRGKATHISPEAPVPVILAEKKELIPGGAANVMVNLAKLGCSVNGAGFVGSDDEGCFLLSCLDELGINTNCVLKTSLSTIYKTRILANGQHVIRYDCDSDFSLADTKYIAEMIRTLAAVYPFDAVVVSDYDKGSVNQYCMDVIRESFSCPVICDTKPDKSSCFSNVYCITPNLTEARRMLGLANGETPSSLAHNLKEEMSLSSVIITMSDDGMLFLDENDQEFMMHAYTQTDEHDPRQRFDVTGAGDTVLSVFAACIAAGLESRFAAFAANIAAGIVVNKIGTAACTFDELRYQLRSYPYP